MTKTRTPSAELPRDPVAMTCAKILNGLRIQGKKSIGNPTFDIILQKGGAKWSILSPKNCACRIRGHHPVHSHGNCIASVFDFPCPGSVFLIPFEEIRLG